MLSDWNGVEQNTGCVSEPCALPGPSLKPSMSAHREALQCQPPIDARGADFETSAFPTRPLQDTKGKESSSHLLRKMKSCLGSPVSSLSFYSLAFKHSNSFFFFFFKDMDLHHI